MRLSKTVSDDVTLELGNRQHIESTWHSGKLNTVDIWFGHNDRAPTYRIRMNGAEVLDMLKTLSEVLQPRHLPADSERCTATRLLPGLDQ